MGCAYFKESCWHAPEDKRSLSRETIKGTVPALADHPRSKIRYSNAARGKMHYGIVHLVTAVVMITSKLGAEHWLGIFQKNYVCIKVHTTSLVHDNPPSEISPNLKVLKVSNSMNPWYPWPCNLRFIFATPIGAITAFTLNCLTCASILQRGKRRSQNLFLPIPSDHLAPTFPQATYPGVMLELLLNLRPCQPQDDITSAWLCRNH
mmetsp:Transcript_38276/g.83374  ORF Transcript_38276/g.83374 Transcript_38276/m.83374 type:complete len:206 (+) Transcript_38276:295-912(+)